MSFAQYDYKKIDLIPNKKSDFRVWHLTQLTQNPANENIITRAIKSQSQIKEGAEVLNEDYKDNKNTSLKSYFKTKKKSKELEFKDVLSPNVNKIVTDVGKLVSDMKQSEENLMKLNINSLINTKKRIKKSEKLNEQVNSIVKKKEKEYKASLEGKIKKTPNYKFLSDIYRRQLNRAFSNFNPLKHMANIHTIIKDNPEINKEFQEKTKIIDNEIFNITSPNFYRNQYKKFHKMFNKRDKFNLDDDDEINNNIKNKEKPKNQKYKNNNYNYSLPKIANRTTMGFHPSKKYYPTETDFTTKGNNKFNLYMIKYDKQAIKKKNLEMRRKFPDKEGRKLELELMEDACKRIMNSIKYINDDDNNFFYKYSKLNSEERKREQNYILRNNSKTEGILLKIQNNNILKGVGDVTDNKRQKLKDDIKDYGRQINIIKDEIIRDIEDHELKEKEQKYLI
jgi:hypothetical protein